MAPPVPVEELGAQLRSAEVPAAGIAESRVLVNGGHLFTFLEQLLQPEEMSVNSLTITSRGDVLDVSSNSLAEEINLALIVDLGVGHGAAPSGGFVRNGSASLSTAKLETTGGGGFVGRSVLAVHLEVSKLDDHLDVGIRRALEHLDEAFSVALVGLDSKLVLANDGLEVGLGSLDIGANLWGDVEVDGLGFGEVGADVGVSEVDLVTENEVINVIVQAVSGGSVHHRVLAHEAGGSIVVDDELKRLVKPAVLAIAVPVLMSALFKSYRVSLIQADHEGGGLNGLKGGLVLRAGIEKSDASVSPNVAVLGSESTDSGGALGKLVDTGELLFKLGGGELLAIDFVLNLEELVVANGNDVLVGGMVEFDRVVLGVSSDSRGVEHPLVAVHTNGQLLHVLGLQAASVDLLLKLKNSRADGSGPLGGVSSSSVISVGIEVAHIGNHRVAVGEISSVIPPFIDPISGVGLFALGKQSLLKLGSEAGRFDKLFYGSLALLKLGFGEKWGEGLEVSLGGVLQSWDGQLGKRILETEHGSFGLVLDITCDAQTVSEALLLF